MSAPAFIHEPDPDNPGWLIWQLSDPTRFNATLGKLLVRLEPDGQARVRMFPERPHSNLANNVHGGVTLAFIDVSLFAASRMFGLIEAASAVTLDLSTQFMGAGRVGEPLDATVELLRETGRLLFLRGLVVQGDERIASFAGTIRKSVRR
ncbi:PaaI family thioesterase [Sphingomonas cavernae]|uniref:PaaI family thioesterase n=1 Tax=Sphingomonas cavernae TaxID=2320861 RepID=A0A418WK67_9SPHN|nr:PaaI family thioesterase [Sphingomonas cavernae]RJF90431.1 PaaI family thioesterase [Sphingomonas cavernae]